MKTPTPKPYAINDFIEWFNRKEIVLSPKYQRRSVWSDKAKSYLIDTIIRGFPIPKLFIKHDVDMKTRKSTRELVDGQQRLRTILSFVSDGFKMLKVHNEDYGDQYFSDLPTDVQKRILQYELSVDVLNDANEDEILEMFARINTYTVTLNKQELLNSRYFGAFKSVVYKIGYTFMQFWLKNNVLSDKEVTRMGEAEFASELTILIMDGIQSKKTVENYYKKYDDVFPRAKDVTKKFSEIMDLITQIFDDHLAESIYASKSMFYTVFSVVNQLREERKIQLKDLPKIYNAFSEIEEFLNNPPEEMSSKNLKFYNACRKSVTDAESRKIRHEYILAKINHQIY